jgi:8-oxo-dGTP pyrophosphatase MutT (NUDIX family)
LLLARPAKEPRRVLWPPQGGINPDEIPFDAARRELLEEIGLEIVDNCEGIVLGGLRYKTKQRDGYTEGKLLVAIGVEVVDRNIRINQSEISSARFYGVQPMIATLICNRLFRPETEEKSEFFIQMTEIFTNTWLPASDSNDLRNI